MSGNYYAKPEEWGKFAAAIRALPEKRRLFFRQYFQGVTSDTHKVCGCATGQLVSDEKGARPANETQALADRLGVRTDAVMALFDLNDEDKAGNTEAECAARYARVLAECDRLSKGEP